MYRIRILYYITIIFIYIRGCKKFLYITHDTVLCAAGIEQQSSKYVSNACIMMISFLKEMLYAYLSYHWTIFDSYKKWLDEQVFQ